MKIHSVEEDVYILAIESSCDETAASVVKNGREVLSNVISSQIALHTLYGGVVPEIASRKHIEYVQYSSCSSYLYFDGEPPLVEGKWWRRGC